MAFDDVAGMQPSMCVRACVRLRLRLRLRLLRDVRVPPTLLSRDQPPPLTSQRCADLSNRRASHNFPLLPLPC